MTTRKERLALNQAGFRIANERMSEWPERRQERRSTGASTYFCECSRTDCRAILRLTSDEYEAVRADSRRFAIAPGHEYAEVERVVDDHGRYAVVEKFEAVAPVVEATDPRGADTERLA
jgi:hypothetical protein